MKKILVTNDDGIDAMGLRKLVEALASIADVYVAAPMVQHSAKSQSITFLHEVDIEERQVKGAKAACAVHGTPTDCIKIGLVRMKEAGLKPDYVMSGINMGYNTGLATYYSGTVAGAREGALNGITSLALSVGSHEATHFDSILENLPHLMELADKLGSASVLNVNVPDIPPSEIKGIKIVPAAPFGYGLLFSFFLADNGNYKLGAEPGYRDDSMTYDMDWNEKGYMTVSPLPISLEDPEGLERLKG